MEDERGFITLKWVLNRISVIFQDLSAYLKFSENVTSHSQIPFGMLKSTYNI